MITPHATTYLQVADTAQLKAELYRYEPREVIDSSPRNIRWLSGNQKVAEVTDRGLVRAVGIGFTNIVALQKEDLASDLSSAREDYDYAKHSVRVVPRLPPVRASSQIALLAFDSWTLPEKDVLLAWGDFGGITSTPYTLMDGVASPMPIPVRATKLKDLERVGGAYLHICASDSQQKIYCWGYTNVGGIGIPPEKKERGLAEPIVMSGIGGKVMAISAGAAHTCVLLESGNVQCWGDNGSGRLGNGNNNDSHTIPVTVSSLGGKAVAVSAGGAHTCALLEGGAVKCWGDNTVGQLGDGTTVEDRRAPVQVKGLERGVKSISAGGIHTCALMENGAVRCWGSGFTGQLGDGTTVPARTEPVDIVGSERGFVAVSAGVLHTCAIPKDGGILCWGNDDFNQLGMGNESASIFSVETILSFLAVQPVRYSPVPVETIPPDEKFDTVVAGVVHSCARTLRGGLKCWGDSSGGKLGGGTLEPQTRPVDVVGIGEIASD